MKQLLTYTLLLLTALAAGAQGDYLTQARQAYQRGKYKECVNLCDLYYIETGTKDALQVKAERMATCADMSTNVYAQRYIAQYNVQDTQAKNRLASISGASDIMCVFFLPSSSEFDGSQHAILNDIAAEMKKNNNIYVLTGWANNYIGSDATNIPLRRNRVTAIKNALTQRGIPDNRLDAQINDGNLPDATLSTEFLANAVTIEKTTKTTQVTTTTAATTTSTAKPSAKISNVRVEPNPLLSDDSGLSIHFKLNINNMKGKKCQVIAYFYDAKNNALVDKNGKFKTAGSPGNVATYRNITPNLENAEWADFQLNIPYDELHLTNNVAQTIKFQIFVWDYSTTSAQTIYEGGIDYSYAFTPPPAIINKVWKEENIISDGVKNLRVHLDMEVRGLTGEKIHYYVFFYKADNVVTLKDGHGNDIRKSSSGTASSEYNHWTDWSITIPNSTFLNAMGTEKECTFDVVIFDDHGRQLARKNNFSVTQSQ